MFRQKDANKTANILDLSKKDQDILVEKIRTGSPEEKLAAKEILLARCQPVIEAIARKYMAHDISIEKLAKLGNRGLIKAIEKYNTSKRYRFIVYATWWIRAEIHKFLNLPIDPEKDK